MHKKCTLGKSCPNPHISNKIKPCTKFAQGSCHYGENCDFSHEVEIYCKFFQKGKCKKAGNCEFKHVYKSCPAYDMGFCFDGEQCEKKHIPRKLCDDYRYGFCPKGSKCDKAHPKLFNESDFAFTEQYFKTINKVLNLYTCYDCRVIGHKVPNCTGRKELLPSETFDCAICNKVHSLDFACS